MSLANDRTDLELRVLARKCNAQRDYIAFLEHENDQLRHYKERNERRARVAPEANDPTSLWDALAGWWKRVGP